MSLRRLFFHICQSRTRQNRTSECLSYGSDFVIHFYLNNWKKHTHTNHRGQHDHRVAPLNVALDKYSLKHPSQTTSATFEMLLKKTSPMPFDVFTINMHTKIELNWAPQYLKKLPITTVQLPGSMLLK